MEKDDLQTVTLAAVAMAFGTIGFIQPLVNKSFNEMNIVFAVVSIAFIIAFYYDLYKRLRR